jgi:Arc/MetJ-type ribon-helix-helix transcriptional regulator
MSAVQLPDELQRAIERHVAEGRATSAAAFLEEAVLRLIDDAAREDDEIQSAAQAGVADMAAGQFSTIATPDDRRQLEDRMMAHLRAGLAAPG